MHTNVDTPGFSPSYGALAAAWVPHAFRGLIDSLVHGAGDEGLGPAGFTPVTLPHQTKDLRRLVGDVRDLLDIFCFAYPKQGEDVWREIRKELALGYRRVGAFKDLFDAQEVSDPAEATYDPVEVKALCLKILDWKRGLLARRQRFADYLSRPKTHKFVFRQGEELAPFFWGEYGAQTEPVYDDAGQIGGASNLRRLIRRLCNRLSPDVKLLARPLDEGGVGDIAGRKQHHQDNREIFHLFRKRLRTIVKLHGRFPLQPRGGVDPATLVAAIERVVVALGDLNNTVLAYERASGRSERERLANPINERWRQIKKDIRTEDMKGTLLALGRLARPLKS